MADSNLLRGVGLIIVAAALFALAARRLRVPTIVAYILAGLFLGPITGLLELAYVIEVVAEVGIVLLLFLVGLELSFDKIRDVGRVAILTGVIQMGITFALGVGLSLLLGFGTIEAVFLAIALSFSSTVVVVKLLEQQKQVHALHGRISVGILLVQDLAVVIVLTFLAGVGAPGSFTLRSVGTGLSGAFLGMGLLLAVVIVASRWVLPRLFGWVASHPETLFVWSLSWCFLFVLGAEAMHLSPEIGAFLAGIALAQLPYNENLRHRVHPLMNVFLAVFFVSLGLQMELAAAREVWVATAVLIVVVIVGKPLLFGWLLARLGVPRQTSAESAITLAQISEFSFISTALGVSVGLIEPALLSVVGAVGLVTMAASAFGVLNLPALRVWLMRLPALRRAEEDGPEPETRLSGHVIVIGMNEIGRRLVTELDRRGETVLAVDSDPAKLEGLPGFGIVGSAEYLGVLEAAGLHTARLLVSTLQIEEMNTFLAWIARRAGVPVSIHAFDRSVIDELRELEVNHLMISKNDGIRRMARELQHAGILGPQ